MLFASCQSLERQNVPLSFGFRLEIQPNPLQIKTCVEEMKKDFSAKTLTLELMVVGDSATGLPKISRTSLVEFSRLILGLQSYDFSFSILLHHSNFRPLFLENNKIDTLQWFAEYEREIIEELLPRLKGVKVNRLGLGTYYEPLESATESWKKLFANVRKKTGIPLLYVSAVEQAEKIRFWQGCDEIGIFYQTSIEQNDKVYAQKWNAKLSALALREKKPLFIAQANLIGENKLIQLQNRLRFWDDDVSINGLVINNIFPCPAPCDSNAYFGLQKEEEVKDFIRKY